MEYLQQWFQIFQKMKLMMLWIKWLAAIKTFASSATPSI